MPRFTRRSLAALGTTLGVLLVLPTWAQAPVAAADQAPDFLASLRATSVTPLTTEDFVEPATASQIEPAALQAVAMAESARGTGYDENGRPLILFEPHIFARRTGGRFNASHPTISYSRYGERPYPSTQDDRWSQLTEAYALAPDEALASTSWGAFQMVGFQYEAAGYPTVQAFVADLAHSPQHQLAAWLRWIRNRGLVDDLQRKDWASFARAYNGPGAAAGGYAERIEEEYARLSSAN